MSKSYDVGYAKPPVGSQFKPGQSGNPKGRPRGSKNIGTRSRQTFLRLVPLKENGRYRRVIMIGAVIISLGARAIHGDPKAAKSVVEIASKCQLLTPEREHASGEGGAPDEVCHPKLEWTKEQGTSPNISRGSTMTNVKTSAKAGSLVSRL
ncbi:MAG TPA: DUF5681 domain-containing protein [Alphaproteobacteria bacterium]|nr:DUF5681 domain-containing protein [Alphaproteobacteria bacterium]